MLSECAASFERKTKKALASLCDTQPTLEIGSTFSYRCHPDDASQFVICPPNSVYANIGRCPENRQFSLSDEKCLAGRTTDCARALDGEGGYVVYIACLRKLLYLLYKVSLQRNFDLLSLIAK